MKMAAAAPTESPAGTGITWVKISQYSLSCARCSKNQTITRARHQHCNQQGDLGKKLAALFHDIELGCSRPGDGPADNKHHSPSLTAANSFTRPVSSACGERAAEQQNPGPEQDHDTEAVLIPRKLASAPIITGPISMPPYPIVATAASPGPCRQVTIISGTAVSDG